MNEAINPRPDRLPPAGAARGGAGRRRLRAVPRRRPGAAAAACGPAPPWSASASSALALWYSAVAVPDGRGGGRAHRGDRPRAGQRRSAAHRRSEGRQGDGTRDRLRRQMRADVYASPVLNTRLALFLKALALVGGGVWCCSSWNEVPDDQAAEYHACLLLIMAGVCLTGGGQRPDHAVPGPGTDQHPDLHPPVPAAAATSRRRRRR